MKRRWGRELGEQVLRAVAREEAAGMPHQRVVTWLDNWLIPEKSEAMLASWERSELMARLSHVSPDTLEQWLLEMSANQRSHGLRCAVHAFVDRMYPLQAGGPQSKYFLVNDVV
ncbi:hypothetical protein [Sphingosinicella sp. BN140058]|uniref:hypothetical protein n=1 Tax=Sphingosinicella sp. BN140058 TaxID=1892855 RepID=UPI001010DEC1|nr:hypothetical protein [Sphingosinicella sp. BN140058]QAY78902.1 hypothetical protein ETR14_21945 [Sphingosinicella sp. BN140058]